MTSFLVRRAALAAAAVTGALALAACGGNGDSTPSGHGSGMSTTVGPSASPSSAAAAHNAADVAFAQQMIPHHRQALQMAKLAGARASSAKVKQLAEKIEKAQDPEIATMSGWLSSWGEQVPGATSGMGGMPGMDHSTSGGASSMPGMMSDADMSRLGALGGKAFDTAFLEMMVNHHAGAVQMAKDEQAKGAYEPSERLAASIATSQTAEISQMKLLLGRG